MTEQGFPTSKLPEDSRQKARRYNLVALCLFIGGLILSLTFWHFARSTIMNTEKIHFDHSSEMVQKLIDERIDQHISALQGIRAFFDASERVTRSEWRQYIDDIDMSHFQGAVGFSFVRHVRREDLDRFLVETRADGAPDFQVATSGNRDDLYIIEFIEPLKGNRWALGYDIGQDPILRRALVDSVERNNVMISGNAPLVHSVTTHSDFHLLLPVYEQGAPLDSLSERREALRGWVDAPICIETLLSGIEGYFDRPLDIEILNADKEGAESLLYDADGNLRPPGKPFSTVRDGYALYTQVASDLHGSRWLLTIRAKSGFLQPLQLYLPTLLLAAGILLSLFASMLVGSYGKLLREAQTLADEMTADLQQSDRMKTEFITTAAHEFRTPLTTIQGYSEYLLSNIDDISGEDREEFLTYIYDRANSLGNMVEDLLDVARIESGEKLPLNLSLYTVTEVFNQLKPFLTTMATHNAVEIALSNEDTLLNVDKERIGQVLENLIGNALKFSPEGSRVEIQGEPVREDYRISVVDHGIGMTPEQTAKVFDKFYRVDASDTAPAGIGMGMCIAKEIIESHGGGIRLASEPGKGTTVVFTVPLGRDGNTGETS